MTNWNMFSVRIASKTHKSKNLKDLFLFFIRVFDVTFIKNNSTKNVFFFRIFFFHNKTFYDY